MNERMTEQTIGSFSGEPCLIQQVTYSPSISMLPAEAAETSYSLGSGLRLPLVLRILLAKASRKPSPNSSGGIRTRVWAPESPFWNEKYPCRPVSRSQGTGISIYIYIWERANVTTHSQANMQTCPNITGTNHYFCRGQSQDVKNGVYSILKEF